MITQDNHYCEATDDGDGTLEPGEEDLTDDIGQFRLHGLSPGDYYLSASFGTSMALDRSEDRTGYAPTFYPGTPVLGEAQKVDTPQNRDGPLTTATKAHRVPNTRALPNS